MILPVIPTTTLCGIQIAVLAEKEAATQRNKELPKVLESRWPHQSSCTSLLPIAWSSFTSVSVETQSENQSNIRQSLQVSRTHRSITTRVSCKAIFIHQVHNFLKFISSTCLSKAKQNEFPGQEAPLIYLS